MSDALGISPHRRIPMAGRDPDEDGRAATPLELLYDLTFVVAIGAVAEQMAELVVAGHTGTGILGFVFGMWAILLGWINFTWLASAFDTDDWVYRLWTMVQMVGVVIVALGIVPMSHSLEERDHLDTHLMVAGYVVMRVGLVAQWIRVSRESPDFRSVALRNAGWILLAQVGWVVFTLLDLPLLPTFLVMVPLGVLELLIAPLAQGRANGTPWHRHHIAERYGLLAIIALGEGVVGTVASSRGALGGATGGDWDLDAVVVLVSGVGLTFGLWWSYFLIPFGRLLHEHPTRGYVFGFGHIPIFIAIAATGAGLHVAGLSLAEAGSGIGRVGIALGVAVPVAAYLLVIDLVVGGILGRLPRSKPLILAGVLAVLGTAVAVSSASLAAALLLTMVASFLPVLVHELGGSRSLTARDASLEV
ncbi:low temperature requirement protein A [Nocardioides sp. DS6]|uniref:Low temperature requirement protein A n=1 Tax=Nocardioides eburneus TaxID=3231482 RepID=A0ABV3T0J2_9ACTN